VLARWPSLISFQARKPRAPTVFYGILGFFVLVFWGIVFFFFFFFFFFCRGISHIWIPLGTRNSALKYAIFREIPFLKTIFRIGSKLRRYFNYRLTCILGHGIAVFPNFRLGISVFPNFRLGISVFPNFRLSISVFANF